MHFLIGTQLTKKALDIIFFVLIFEFKETYYLHYVPIFQFPQS